MSPVLSTAHVLLTPAETYTADAPPHRETAPPFVARSGMRPTVAVEA